ncbi:thiol:disulfide interchange protein DsbG [Bordetella avium]|uniref:Thiol:disulfide interchange protein n=1 Tax=Bordetella avium (strain 197N) TaxID=360910 RepID=Q2KW82_BORA1|nr:thiol:disulfide interchange protein DsbG [Bordetella avium]AZY50060.1 thiol:disulfide interchange protein DsbG [Bordetella avium]AZY53425.1 thiol:disulfide interchange protein DsbG [Bordetella avium]RIQ12982.1 thiol:disulfide interchange protein DsbG [Bordetella avium]RIQ17417.1 thiol:disulfide interchange protein DsbG [Bordetella avium]RIQ33904.1 thiol:disulfide interchange protein DsbG [Bordetella avium]
MFSWPSPHSLRHSLIAGLMLLSAGSYAQATEQPAVLKALEGQGLVVMQEFKVGGGLRAFAAVAGDQPVAIYVTSDGNAILGTRLDSKGESLDDETLEKLAAKPISDKTWAQLEAAKWVRDGSANAPRVIYTFSDANCPYCHRFWEAARPWVDAGKVQLRHIMVGVIRQDSPGKAAAILEASDPSAALVENELNFDKGGIKPLAKISDSVRRTLEDNRLLMLDMGFRGTPGIVIKDDTGLVQKIRGMPQAASFEEVFGPR